jgi:S-layer family protein
MNRFSVWLCLSLFAAATATAQSPHDYGTQDSNYRFLPATDFHGNFNMPYVLDAFDYVGQNSSSGCNCGFRHEIDVPTGAFLENLRLYFYDLTLSTDITFELCKSSVESDTGLNPARSCITTSTTAAPGYGSLLLDVNQTFLTQMQLDGDPALEEVRWTVVVTMPEPYTTQKFAGVRLKWKRQVSPAPATATFADVPTNHLFFQFIEALADSGITTGCSPGNFCPDAPLTRGQMAVFLSRALGLHWVP